MLVFNMLLLLFNLTMANFNMQRNRPSLGMFHIGCMTINFIAILLYLGIIHI